MLPVGEHPACKDDDCVAKARLRERRTKSIDQAKKCNQRVRDHPSSDLPEDGWSRDPATTLDRMPDRSRRAAPLHSTAMARLIRTSLESSSLASITYDPKDGLLEVEYRRTGRFYHYFDVPRAIYRALMDADSKGAFLNQIIKPNFDYVCVDIPLA